MIWRGEKVIAATARQNCRLVIAGRKEVTDKTFDDFVIGFPGPVLAEFWAPW